MGRGNGRMMEGWMEDANRAIEVTSLGSDWIVSGVVS